MEVRESQCYTVVVKHTGQAPMHKHIGSKSNIHALCSHPKGMNGLMDGDWLIVCAVIR